MQNPWRSQLPTAIGVDQFISAARASGGQAACCVFSADGVEPGERRGYAALVVAYSRDGEPVTVLDDGSAALLIRNGGTAAAAVAARRVLHQAARIGLDQALRVGIAAVGHDPGAALDAALAQARTGEPGEVPATA